MKLSVIVPCFNEEAGINEFYDSLVSSLKKEKITYEIIMINDGSTDDTSLKIKELNKKDKNVKLISFSRNFGKESAMLAGLKHSSGDYISIMDADMQHTPSMLIDLYRKLQDDANYDVACAYKADRFDEGTLKRALTAMFYRINNLISDYQIWNIILFETKALNTFCNILNDSNIDQNLFIEICMGIENGIDYCDNLILNKLIDEYYIIFIY